MDPRIRIHTKMSWIRSTGHSAYRHSWCWFWDSSGRSPCERRSCLRKWWPVSWRPDPSHIPCKTRCGIDSGQEYGTSYFRIPPEHSLCNFFTKNWSNSSLMTVFSIETIWKSFKGLASAYHYSLLIFNLVLIWSRKRYASERWTRIQHKSFRKMAITCTLIMVPWWLTLLKLFHGTPKFQGESEIPSAIFSNI